MSILKEQCFQDNLHRSPLETRRSRSSISRLIPFMIVSLNVQPDMVWKFLFLWLTFTLFLSLLRCIDHTHDLQLHVQHTHCTHFSDQCRRKFTSEKIPARGNWVRFWATTASCTTLQYFRMVPSLCTFQSLYFTSVDVNLFRIKPYVCALLHIFPATWLYLFCLQFMETTFTFFK